jgi:hypothetical protein
MSIHLADGIARTCAGVSVIRRLHFDGLESYAALEVG